MGPGQDVRAGSAVGDVLERVQCVVHEEVGCVAGVVGDRLDRDDSFGLYREGRGETMVEVAPVDVPGVGARRRQPDQVGCMAALGRGL